MRKMLLVSGTSNRELAEKIARFSDADLIDPQITRFANGEIYCEMDQNVRGAEVFVVQSLTSPVNDHIMELLIMIDALKRASAQSIVAVIPHYGYARQDRKVRPRSPITAKLLADILTVSGATRVMTMDLHAGQIQGFFNIPFDNIYASPVFIEYFKEQGYPENMVCASPDTGGVDRVRAYAKKLKLDLALIDKRRTGPNVAKAMNVIGDVKDRDVVIIDDMIDTAGTIVEAVKALKNEGANKIMTMATHGVLSDPALERIAQCKDLEEVLITDTVPLTEAGKKLEKIKVLSTAEILSRAILRTYHNDSVSSLFT